jgi:hypothetical protein
MQGSSQEYPDGYKYPPRSKIMFLTIDGIERTGITSEGGGYYTQGKKRYCGNYINNGNILPECFLNLEEERIIGLLK